MPGAYSVASGMTSNAGADSFASFPCGARRVVLRISRGEFVDWWTTASTLSKAMLIHRASDETEPNGNL